MINFHSHPTVRQKKVQSLKTVGNRGLESKRALRIFQLIAAGWARGARVLSHSSEQMGQKRLFRLSQVAKAATGCPIEPQQAAQVPALP